MVATGCLREPTFTPRDAAGDGGGDGMPDAAVPACPEDSADVAVMPNGTGVRVCGPRYQVEFSEAGAHFPSELLVDGTPLMATGERCNDERGTGIALYPSVLVNGETTPQVNATIAIELGGATDAVAKVGIDWSAGYTCGGGAMAGELGNRTTFSFFPDGRVSRQDRIAHAATITAGACSTCEPTTAGDPFFLTSFTTLVADANAQIVGAIGGDASALASHGDAIDAGDDVCLATRMRNVGFGWRASASTQARVRVARARTAQDPAAFAFTFDRLRAASTISSTTAETLLRTTMILGGAETSCSAVLGRVAALGTNVPIELTYGNGAGTVNLIANLDGIYGGEDENQQPGFDVPGDPTQPMTLAIPPAGQPVTGGFAVWLDLAQFYPTITVTKTPAPTTTTWFRLQRAKNPTTAAQSQIVLWFPDGLALGETITIDADP